MCVRARLEVDVKSASASALARSGQSLFLGVRRTWTSVVAFARDQPIRVEHNGSDHGVGTGAEISARRELYGARRPSHVDARIWILCRQTPGNIRCPRGCAETQGMIDNRIRSMRFSRLPLALDHVTLTTFQELKREL